MILANEPHVLVISQITLCPTSVSIQQPIIEGIDDLHIFREN